MEWLNKISVCVCTCGCTCSGVRIMTAEPLSQSYISLHAATSPLGKALERSHPLRIKSLISRYSPGCFQSWRNGRGLPSRSVDGLMELPIRNSRTGVYLPLVMPLPFLAASKCPQSLFSHPFLQETAAKSAQGRPFTLPLPRGRS